MRSGLVGDDLVRARLLLSWSRSLGESHSFSYREWLSSQELPVPSFPSSMRTIGVDRVELSENEPGRPVGRPVSLQP